MYLKKIFPTTQRQPHPTGENLEMDSLNNGVITEDYLIVFWPIIKSLFFPAFFSIVPQINLFNFIRNPEIQNTSWIVHKLEPKNETFLGLVREPTRNAAQYDFREVIVQSFLISDGVTLCYKDDIFSRAPISCLVLLMIPETKFSES